MTSEFNLSERIEQLKKELKENAKLNDGQIDGIIRMISFMDREFIRLLKERMLSNSESYVDNMKCLRTDWLIKIVNQLAGQSLVEEKHDK
jgi:hypothetical protein